MATLPWQQDIIPTLSAHVDKHSSARTSTHATRNHPHPFIWDKKAGLVSLSFSFYNTYSYTCDFFSFFQRSFSPFLSMNPSQCSVILVKNSGASEDNDFALLASVYNEVVVAPNEDDTWELLYKRQKLHRTTLIVYDIDTINDRKFNTTELPDTKRCFKFLRNIVRQLRDGIIHDSVPIVCSGNDSPKLMIDCLHNGAADFLVKPMHVEQVKALFLNVYRYRISRSQIGTIDPVYRVIEHELHNPSPDVAVDSAVATAAAAAAAAVAVAAADDDDDDNDDSDSDSSSNNSFPPFHLKQCALFSRHHKASPLQRHPQLHGAIWNYFKERIKSVYYTENWLAQTIYNYYAPEPALLNSPHLPLTREDIVELRQMICSWEFLPADLDELRLVQLVCLIFRQVLSHPALIDLNVCDDDLHTFVFDICNSYHKTNPYHNFRHAVDVLQSMYYFLCKLGVLQFMTDIKSAPEEDDKTTPPLPDDSPPPVGGQCGATAELQSLLRPIDVFALFLACIGHDIGHPGVTNMFMIKSCTPLALLYNDRSVLESFHSMAFFHLLRNSCFQKLTQARDWPEYAYFRKIIVSSILATDMAMHDEYVQQIEQQAEKWHSNELNLDDEAVRDRERLTLCGALIKCADISNCARPFPVAKKWAVILSEEFALQGDLEKELGLVSLPINERGKVSLEQFQLGFKRNIARKLYQAVAALLPAMQFCVDNIDINVRKWEDRMNRFNHDSGVAEQESRDNNEDEDENVNYRQGNESERFVKARDVMAKQVIELAPYAVSSSELSQDDETVLLDMTSNSPKPLSAEMGLTRHQQWPSDHHQHQGRVSALCQCTVQ